jgi:hypothetical protein
MIEREHSPSKQILYMSFSDLTRLTRYKIQDTTECIVPYLLLSSPRAVWQLMWADSGHAAMVSKICMAK